MVLRRLGAAVLLSSALSAGPALAAGPTVPNNKAEMQGLDKVTARVVRIEVTLDQPVRFGTLLITLKACFTSPPTETPEAAAFLEIDDLDQDREERIFSGWVYASSPSLHALEHPVYDVWLTGCIDPLLPDPPASVVPPG
ncbi:DUF2155 domain-containing protein [Geminicoccus roseus]|uniref:DUF2155 domain-containing protein n=1 Tax=Geminicoccus roseus TaxID=404900 RepID=UPI00146FB7D6|nr:DUF2155 domain-containing protein [Geminicoccus roseus]